MAYSGKSPNKFLGSITKAITGAQSGSGNAILKKAMGQATGSVPSVVATAGASGMSGRIQGIESRLEALESNSPAAGGMQPAVAPPSDLSFAQAATAARKQAEVGNQVTPGAGITGGILGGPQAEVAASEELGALMASPFTMRQRANMGTLKLKNK